MKKSRPAKSETFSFRALSQGLLIAFLAYAAAASFAFFNAEETLRKIEDRLPSGIFQIERPESAPAPAKIAVREIFGPPFPSIKSQAGQPGENIGASHAEARESAPKHSGPLEPAPLDGLIEMAPEGKLPKISASGLAPFDAYKRPYSYEGKPVIALAVLDYGLSEHDSTQALSRLPPEVSFILSPHAKNLEEWQKKARAAGHEVWLAMPREHSRYLGGDPGPGFLLADADFRTNEERINRILGAATGYAGVASETGKSFFEMHSTLKFILQAIYRRGLGYLELNGDQSAIVESIAAPPGSAFAGARIHESVSGDDLSTLESEAREYGYAAMAFYAYPKNLETAEAWIPGLQAEGFSIAPVSALAKMNAAPPQQAHDSGPDHAPAHHE